MSGGRARSPRVWSRTLVGVAVLAAVLLTACDPPFPSDDPFYEPPSPLPAGQPGRHHLVPAEPRSRSTRSPRPRSPNVTVVAGALPVDRRPRPADGGDRHRARADDAVDRRRAAARSCPTPSAPGASATTARRRTRCRRAPTTRASSSRPRSTRAGPSPISDYQGLGTPGLHTYMVGPAQGHAVLDMARAAERLARHRPLVGHARSASWATRRVAAAPAGPPSSPEPTHRT